MSNLALKVRIAQVLEEVVTGDNGDLPQDFMTYQEGWSDGRVAQTVGATVQQVVAVRKALYGARFIPPVSSSTTRFEARLEQLERRVAELERKQADAERGRSQKPWVEVPGIVPRWDQQQRA